MHPFDFNTNKDYTVGRFSKTIVMYQGLPCYIEDISGNLNAVCFNQQGYFETSLHDKDFDFGPITLGHVRLDKELLFLRRTPSRQWKQGLSNGNLKGFNLTGAPSRLNLKHLVRENSFIACCRKQFDNLEHGEKITPGFLFLSNDILTSKDADNIGSLYYRGRLAGLREKNVFTLVDKYLYLKETIEELGGHVN